MVVQLVSLPVTRPIIAPATLARAKALVQRSLTESGVNARTGATLPCRISKASGTQRIGGVPSYVTIPQFRLVFRADADVRAGDVVTIAGHGAYSVLESMQPTSISAANDALAVRTDPYGAGIPVAPNAAVQFRNPATGQRTPAVLPTAPNVRVFSLNALQIQMYGLTPGRWWGVIFDPNLAYADGSKPEQNHFIHWSGLGIERGGGAVGAAITRPMREPGELPVAVAYFLEVA